LPLVSETGSLDRIFLACVHACCIAPKALPGHASAEISAEICHFENCKGDSRAASNRLRKRDQVVE